MYGESYLPKDPSGAHMCPGTLPVHIRHIWYRNGVWAHMGTGMVLRHIQATSRCPGTYGSQNSARAHIGTERVPGHIWALEGCPGTKGHRQGARIHMGSGRVPGQLWPLEGCPAYIGTGREPGHI